MSKKKDLIKDDEFINVEPTTPEVENTEGESEANENITPDVVNVEPTTPAINQNEDEESKEELVTLKINKNFTDKYDNSIKYVKCKEYSFEVKRAEELLADKRNLVSKVK